MNETTVAVIIAHSRPWGAIGKRPVRSWTVHRTSTAVVAAHAAVAVKNPAMMVAEYSLSEPEELSSVLARRKKTA
jgi:hypothetical protein